VAKHRSESKIKAQARKWFALHAQEYRNLTDAAESCAWELGHDEWLDDPDHWVWELAIEYMPERNPALAPGSVVAIETPQNAMEQGLAKKDMVFNIAEIFNVPGHGEYAKCVNQWGVWWVHLSALRLVGPLLFAKRNPSRATRWPSPVERVATYIWALIDKHPDPDVAELNPIIVEHNDSNNWTIGFDESVILYGWNDGYTYNPKKRAWRVFLGDTGKTRARQTTAQVEARIRQLLGADL
jgi:hypothetical protein